MQVLGFTLFFFKNTYATSSLPSLECFKRATLRVSLPEGTTCGSSSDPWLNEGWILYKSGTNWTFTVKITQHSRRHSSYDTHLIIALNYEAYEKLLNLKINGSYICKNSFKYGTPQPYNVWTWPDDVYPTWFNDESVNLGTILPRKSKIVIVTVLFSDNQNVKMHFDAYGKKTRWTPHHKSSIYWSPNSGDSTVLSVTEPLCAEFTYSPVFPKAEELITFNATLSYSPNGYIASYTWNFGDGNITNLTNDIITHLYSSEGTYSVTLTVTDDDGVTNSTTKTILVAPPTLRKRIIHPSIDGYITFRNGMYESANADWFKIYVGQKLASGGDYVWWRGFFRFDLTNLSKDNISSARLHVFYGGELGSGAGGVFLLNHVEDMGNTLDETDWYLSTKTELVRGLFFPYNLDIDVTAPVSQEIKSENIQ